MFRAIRALFDGLILRCPHCHTGRMFASGFTMNQVCPVCGTQFERSAGETTGGMGINILVTSAVIIVCALIFGLNAAVPLAPLLIGLVLFTILFPIAFYRSSRGLWAGWLYIIGNNAERD